MAVFAEAYKELCAEDDETPEDNAETPFVLTRMFYEDHQKAIYSCCFNPYAAKDHPPLLATVGINQCVIYEVSTTPGGPIQPVRCFSDASRRFPDEDSPGKKTVMTTDKFYTVNWLFDEKDDCLMVVYGGESSTIHCVNVKTGAHVKIHYGHGNVVNDIRVHPSKSTVYASCSKDTTIRLWSSRCPHALAVFAGFTGHRDQVLSLDFSLCGMYVLSASMDHTVKMWPVTDQLQDRIEETTAVEFDYEKSPLLPEPRESRFGLLTRVLDEPLEIMWPIGETGDLHTNYVDCVRTFHDFVFSKSSENQIKLWKFGDFRDGFAGGGALIKDKEGDPCPETSISQLATLFLWNGDTWFLKFAIDPLERWLVAGVRDGYLHMWKLHADDIPQPRPDMEIQVGPCVVRQISFDPYGRMMMSVSDDGSISRIDRVFKGQAVPVAYKVPPRARDLPTEPLEDEKFEMLLKQQQVERDASAAMKDKSDAENV